jgi:hypothetical protein
MEPEIHPWLTGLFIDFGGSMARKTMLPRAVLRGLGGKEDLMDSGNRVPGKVLSVTELVSTISEPRSYDHG